jgi:hypothetical protein
VRLAVVVLAAVAAAVLWRRRRTAEPQVVIAWPDGTEIRLREGRAEHERIVAVAGRALE